MSYQIPQITQKLSAIDKQNRPIKQGGIYSLNLGKNNGPFLPKDIMFNNPKSIQLLVGKEIVKNHTTLAKSLEQFDTRKRKEQESLKDSFLKEEKGMGLAQNIIDYGVYLNSQINVIKKSGAQLGVDIKKFKQQLQQLQKKINYNNSSNMAQFAPCLKNLYNSVKKSFNDEKDKVYWLTRQLQQVRSSGNKLSLQMNQCEDRLSVIQQIIGVKNQHYDELVINQNIQDESQLDLEYQQE